MVKTHMLASSVEGRPIHAYELENDAPAILIFGGMHGDEPQSAFAAERIVELLNTRVGEMMDEHLIVVPRLNPDALERGTRKNPSYTRKQVESDPRRIVRAVTSGVLIPL